MPTYEYACELCRTIYTFSFSEHSAQDMPLCPSCCKPSLNKLTYDVGVKGALLEDRENLLDDEQVAQSFSSFLTDTEKIQKTDSSNLLKLISELTDNCSYDLGEEIGGELKKLEEGGNIEQIEQKLAGALLEGTYILDNMVLTRIYQGKMYRYDETQYSAE